MDREEQSDLLKTATGGKKSVDSTIIAKLLLQHALNTEASPELRREFSPNHMDELLFFNLFTVDYLLMLKSVNNPVFDTVRYRYKEEIERFSECGDQPQLMHDLVASHFEVYAEACMGEGDCLYRIGRAFSRLSHDEPNRSDALASGVTQNRPMRVT